MAETYRMKIAGLERELPLCRSTISWISRPLSFLAMWK